MEPNAKMDAVQLESVLNGNDLSAKLNLLLRNSNTTEKKIDGLNQRIDDIKHSVDQFDERFAAIETRSKTNEANIAAAEVKITDITKKVTDCKTSADFISDQYDELKTSIAQYKEKLDGLEKQFTDLNRENVSLRAGISDSLNQLEQEKAGRNQDAQYLRTSLNLKLCGLPLQPGEEIRSDTPSNVVTRALITRVCEASNISFPESDIDVCHRLGFDRRSPIIIRFTSKSSRYSFYSQRSKLNDISTQDVDYAGLPKVLEKPKRSGRGGYGSSSRGGAAAAHAGVETHRSNASEGETESHGIYIQEHLTKYSKDLLKEAKETFSTLNFEYPGYVKDGEVRIKRTADCKPQVIRCRTDIKRFKEEASSSS